MNSTSETLLIAILHKAGQVRIDEDLLRETLNTAANENAIFEQFKQHPQYHFSEVLDGILRLLMLGGMMVREGEGCFVFASRILKKYGAAQFNELTAAEKKAVEKVAESLRSRCQAAK